MNIIKKNNLIFNKIIKNKINITRLININKDNKDNNNLNKDNKQDNKDKDNKQDNKQDNKDKDNKQDNKQDKQDNKQDNIINKNNINKDIKKDNINKDIKNKDNIINRDNINKDIKKDNINKDNIINRDNINLFIDDFKNITKVRIFGKGPSFKNIISNNNDLHIAVNQAANELTKCDMLAINDLHNIYLIRDDIIKNLKFIITPEYLHINQRFNINGHFSKVYDYIVSKGFIGKYIVYNLNTNLNPNKKYISLYNSLTTSNTVAEFVCVYLKKYIKNIEFYGVGIHSNKNYSDNFKGNGTYDTKRINEIRKYINEVCKNNNINYEIH